MNQILTEQKQRWLTLALGFYMLSTLVSMATMSIGTVVLVVALVFSYGGPRAIGAGLREVSRERHASSYLRVSLVLALCFSLSVIFAKAWPMGFGADFIHVALWPNISKLWYLFWPFLILLALAGLQESSRLQILKTWLMGFFLLSLLGLIQFYFGWPRPQQIPNLFNGATRYHATLFLGHHLSVASVFIFPFFASLEFLRDGSKSRDLGMQRVVMALIAGFGFLLLFLTYSRTLWLALPVGIFFWVLWNLSRKSGFIFSGAFGALLVVLSQTPLIRQRLLDSVGTATRQRLWLANWEFFKMRPLTGVGWRQNQELSGIYLKSLYPGQRIFQGHAHNNFLDILAGTGTLGTLAWLTWCGVVFWVIWPSARKSVGFARGLFCAWIVFHLNGLTQLNFWEAKVTHQMMLMIAWSLLWVRSEKCPA
jgi:O-antigen ligase